MPQQDRLNIAVFIDFDNIEIGVKNTLGQQFDAGTILEAIKERGEIVTKIAYADWTRAGDYSRALTQHAIRLVQRNLTPGGDKNGADINLALDALEMAFTHPHINAYVIVGGDSDFLSLVEKLKQYDKKVFVVGGRAFTSIILQRNCHEFIAYENLAGVRKAAIRSGPTAAASGSAPIGQAFPIVRRALQILADREVSPQTGLLKSTLLQLDSTFSERTYGSSSFLDFVEKLAQAGLVRLKHSGRSVMVELNDGFDEGDAGDRISPPQPEHVESRASTDATQPVAEGVKRVGRILAGAKDARWPMYLRNVKQLLRAGDSGFDERRYGFTGLMDLMRACQREGIVRLERDRRGGLRAFPGAALQRPELASQTDVGPQANAEVAEAESPMAAPLTFDHEPEREPAEFSQAIETESVSPDQAPVDATAERLGRAAPKRRSRTSAAQPPKKAARTGGAPTRRTPARRAPRTKKPLAAANDEVDQD